MAIDGEPPKMHIERPADNTEELAMISSRRFDPIHGWGKFFSERQPEGTLTKKEAEKKKFQYVAGNTFKGAGRLTRARERAEEIMRLEENVEAVVVRLHRGIRYQVWTKKPSGVA